MAVWKHQTHKFHLHKFSQCDFTIMAVKYPGLPGVLLSSMVSILKSRGEECVINSRPVFKIFSSCCGIKFENIKNKSNSLEEMINIKINFIVPQSEKLVLGHSS